jgi:hypothetical protein
VRNRKEAGGKEGGSVALNRSGGGPSTERKAGIDQGGEKRKGGRRLGGTDGVREAKRREEGKQQEQMKKMRQGR